MNLNLLLFLVIFTYGTYASDAKKQRYVLKNPRHQQSKRPTPKSPEKVRDKIIANSVKLPLSVTEVEGQEWQNDKCFQLQLLMKRKDYAVKKIREAVKKISNDSKFDASLAEFRVRTLKVFQAELDDSSRLAFEVLGWLEQALKGNYKDFSNIKRSSQKRLELLRDATLSEEQMFNILLEAEKIQEEHILKEKLLNHTRVEGIIGEILSEVAQAADRLERDLNDHVFDNAIADKSQEKGANIEAVVRLRDDDEKKSNVSNDAMGAMKLVDANDNQYVLAKGKDSTIPVEDHHLIQDVISLTLLAFLFGWICTVIRLPNMFGYILSGVVLGPSGVGYIKSLVQVETLGEFGVFFILFSVGLEFSPDKLKRVFRIATVGSVMMMAAMVLCGILLGTCVSSTPNESAFISACLSLSSTPLVFKFLSAGKDDEDLGGHEVSSSDQSRYRKRTDTHNEYSPMLMGILVMQDILLGVLIALLPAIAGRGNSGSASADSVFLEYFHITIKLIASFIGVILLTVGLAKFCIGPLYKYLLSSGNREMSMLATLVLAFAMLMVTNFLDISMELGCFLAGTIVSTQGHQVAEQVSKLVVSVKDFLGCIFFASIGLHVFPKFLAFEITILTTFTLAVVSFKFFSSVAVLHFILPKNAVAVKWIVSAGLAQVSEFSFVLGSRARRLGLISREVYLLILSITTLSLLLAPVLWYMTLWHLRLRTQGTRSRHSSDVEKTEDGATLNSTHPTLKHHHVHNSTS